MPQPPIFSVEDFRCRVAQREDALAALLEDGDFRFNPGRPKIIREEPLRPAAVLVPVVDHGGAASVLLTRRSEKLRSHSGQVAFPGGRIDPEDGTPERAALREAEEEIGLDGAHVEIIGRMPDYVSGSGYRIAPVLSVVKPGFHLTINTNEVDAVFEAPLAFLMDPVNHVRASRVWGDQEWTYFDMPPFEGQRIWGVTAGIIRTIYERLYA